MAHTQHRGSGEWGDAPGAGAREARTWPTGSDDSSACWPPDPWPLAALAAPATATAAGSLITVTTEYDGNEVGDGLCTLREAIVSANENAGNTNDDCTDGQSGEPDQIQIQIPFRPAGYIILASNLPSITDPSGLTIEGIGTIVIDGQDSYTPFSIVGGSLTLSGLVVQNGFGTSGGAVTNGGSVTISKSTIRSSSAFEGGGIYNSGSMTIIDSTIEGNEATQAGGGIFNEDSITLENVTLAGNRAGVDAALSQSTGESTLRHVTVSLNVSDNAVVHRNGGTMDIFNSIVAGNSDGETSGVTTTSHSLLRDSSAGVLDAGGLKDNGGPTRTIRLVGGSNPALGLGAHATCSDVGFVDQRGFARPSGATDTCDAGAAQRDRTAPAKVRNPSMGLRHLVPGEIRSRVLDWAFDDGTGIGIQRFSIQRQRDGGSWTTLSTYIYPQADIGSAATAHYNVNLANWHSYRFRVRAVDFDGNVSVWAYSPTVLARMVQQTSRAVTFSRTGWSTVSSTRYSGGSVRTSTTPGSSMRITFTGRAIALVTTIHPGPPVTVDAYVDGVYRGPLQLSSYVTAYGRQVWPFRFSGRSEHTLRFVNVGPGRLDIDAFAILK